STAPPCSSSHCRRPRASYHLGVGREAVGRSRRRRSRSGPLTILRRPATLTPHPSNPFTGGTHGDRDEDPLANERAGLRVLQLRLRLWLQLRRLPEFEGRQLPRARRLHG